MKVRRNRAVPLMYNRAVQEMPTIAALHDQLAHDEWRDRIGFSDDIAAANERIRQATSTTDIATALNDWLARQQPCLFGRIAAKNRLMRYCILTEQDLSGSDEAIQLKIQHERSSWWADAFNGRASG